MRENFHILLRITRGENLLLIAKGEDFLYFITNNKGRGLLEY